MDDDRRGERLRADLLALRDGLDIPETDGSTMAERVLARIVAEAVPAPVREPVRRRELVGAWFRDHARLLAAALSGLLVVLVLTPPVRATVVEWFDFGGVRVRYAPGTPSNRQGPGAPGCGAPVSMHEALRSADFRPVVPHELGRPDSVAVTRLPEGRSMITLCWQEGGRTVRLDEFASGLDPYFIKQVRVRSEWLGLDRGGSAEASDGSSHGRGGQSDDRGDPSGGMPPGPAYAAWIAEPHLLEFMMIGEDGDRWIRSERTAGPTLLWTRDERITFRLEGVDDRDRARAIAESTL
ncbi:hypothetical protein [Streptomyces sp. NPDC057428]|uniref:hypothetical protein n=1 Tax=Streptomyces sp. NPDC057428 TaxID=3346129 RepID=UPI0036829042